MAFIFSYLPGTPDTLDSVRDRVNSMSIKAFLECLTARLGGVAAVGCQATYDDGAQTPNSMWMQAMAERLGRTHGIDLTLVEKEITEAHARARADALTPTDLLQEHST